jgi:hypothetical protein
MISRMLAWAVVACLALGASAQGAFVEEEQFGSGFTIPVAWGDPDRDGDFDLAVGNFNQPNELYVNDGAGGFTGGSAFGSGATFAVAWGDYDNDGDADLAVGNGYNQFNALFINNGDGTFTQETQFGQLRTCAVAWGDYDKDGDLDLAVGNGILNVAEQNMLYVNNGDGTFTGEPQFGVGQTGSLVWGDCDRDGDLDLAVGNGGFGYSGQNYLYINNGDGTFTEQAEFGEGDTASLYWGDCDNDGDLDMAVGNWDAQPNMLYVNTGDGTFTGAPQFGSRDTNTLAWGDADNDGDLDIAVGNGDFSSAEGNQLYVNNGDGTYGEQAAFGDGSTDGVAWGDCDGDGDLDLASGNEHSPPQNYLYVNDANTAEYLLVHLAGHVHDMGAGHSNRDGVGAKVCVYEAGYVGDPGHLLGFREIAAHGGFASQNAIDAHFGLPGRGAVDMRIIWPGSGGMHITQDLEGIAVGQRIIVDETGTPCSVPDAMEGSLEPGFIRATPHPVRGHARLAFIARHGSLQRADVFDLSGARVRELVLEGPDAHGVYHASWDGRTAAGARVPSGAYVVRAQGRGGTLHGRLLLLH